MAATTQLTFGGEPLAFDAESQVGDFLERFLRLEELVGWAAPAHERSGRNGNRSGNYRNVGLPQGGYPAPPPLRLSQLYWPTGAARWAAGVFLADKAAKEKIVTAAHKSGSNAPLTFKAGDGNRTLETSLYLLPPRPVNTLAAGCDLWLLPLVDERYFWQFKHFGDNEVTSSTTWANLFSTLGTQLGVTIIADAIDSAYLRPDPEEFSRRYDNAAAMLDAAAHSAGQRIVRTTGGTIYSMGWATSQATHEATAATARNRLAGGEIERDPVPASVVLTSQRLIDHVANFEGRAHAYAKTADSAASADQAAHTTDIAKVIHSSAYADFSTSGGTSSPDNNTALNALATWAARDYYKSLLYSFDHVFDGIAEWNISGYDDHQLFCFHREHESLEAETIAGDGPKLKTNLLRRFELESYTRIQSAPHSFAPEEQLSQDSSVSVLEPFQLVTLDEALAADGNATASVYIGDDTRDPNTEADANVNVEVYDFPGRAIASGALTAAIYDFEGQRWYPLVIDTIDGDDVWLGMSASQWYHKQPGSDSFSTSQVNTQADKDTFHTINYSLAGGLVYDGVPVTAFVFDDGGHLYGLYVCPASPEWDSPWGAAEPGA